MYLIIVILLISPGICDVDGDLENTDINMAGDIESDGGLANDMSGTPNASIISDNATSLLSTETPNTDMVFGNITSGTLNTSLLTDNVTSSVVNDTNYPLYYYDYEEDLELLLMDHSIWVTSIPGVIFNTFTIVIVCKMKPFSTNSLFMLVLGAVDLLNVVARITSAITYFLEAVDNVGCKIMDFLVITTFNYSNIILVCWTVERFVAVCFPMKYALYCTFRNTLIALVVAGVILSLLSIPYLVGTYAAEEHGIVYCNFSEFLYSIWTPIETSYYIWIPMIVISVSNVFIVLRLISNTKGRINQGVSNERAQQRSREQRQMTKVLLSVCLAFLILHIPQVCVTLYLSITSGKLEAFITDYFGPLKSLRWSFIVTEFQNSVNFFLYCLTGREFRAYVYKKICCYRNDGNKTSTVTKTKSVPTDA